MAVVKGGVISDSPSLGSRGLKANSPRSDGLGEMNCKGRASLLSGVLELICSGLRSGKSREGLLYARAIARGDICSAKLVKLAQEGVGISENANALDVTLQL